jgi:hypothetical protein
MMRVFRGSYIVDVTVQLSNARSKTMMGLCGTNDGNKCVPETFTTAPFLSSSPSYYTPPPPLRK